MNRIRFSAKSGNMAGTIHDVPAFPGESFGIGFPEAIGDVAGVCWFNLIKPSWREREDGAWRSEGRRPGELSYRIDIVPHEDSVDARIRLTNESDRTWERGLAFNCFNCGATPSIRDHDCVRHHVRMDGAFRRLVEIPRRFGPRPAIQFYSVQGQPPGDEIPFVAAFQATSEATLEGWIAITDVEGRRLVAAVSRPALFLFQNMEYSCIHSGAGFDSLAPGETGEAITRLYFVESTLDEWYHRMIREMHSEQAGADPPA